MNYPAQDFIELGDDDCVQLANKKMDDMDDMDDMNNAIEDLGKLAVSIVILLCFLLGIGIYIYAS